MNCRTVKVRSKAVGHVLKICLMSLWLVDGGKDDGPNEHKKMMGLELLTSDKNLLLPHMNGHIQKWHNSFVIVKICEQSEQI